MTERCAPICRTLVVVAVTSTLALTAPALAFDPDTVLTDYEKLKQWSFSTDVWPVPPEGVTWRVDEATIQLESGSIRLQRPTSDGTVTGLVFEGNGRLTIEVPDPIELRQLRRFAGDPSLERFDQRFESAVIRYAGDVPFPTGLGILAGPFESNRLARERHDRWLTLSIYDADARVAATLHDPYDRYVAAEFETEDHGWATLLFDPAFREELELLVYNRPYAYSESWLSLDRQEDRLETGRPSATVSVPIAIETLVVDADLTDAGRNQVGLSDMPTIDAVIEATVGFRALGPAGPALRFSIHPGAEVTSVVDHEGRELSILRDHVGSRSSRIHKKYWDGAVVVLLPTSLESGATGSLTFTYEVELDSYGPGRIWYPTIEASANGIRHLGTAEMTFTIPKNREVRAMGERLEVIETDDEKRSTWRVDRPAKMFTFFVAPKPWEEPIEREGVPTVIPFASLGGKMSKQRARAVGEDTINSVTFFQRLFDEPISAERLYVSMIPATHGQSFDGFLHIGDWTTTVDAGGAAELLRAHEVAHQWWGHMVGWDGYRHQWLSEGLAEYSALMFVERSVARGEELMLEALAAFSDELKGSLQSRFSQFTRPGVELLNKAGAERLGPIGHGQRCAVGEAKTGYSSLVYKKGAIVFHMLRVVLRDRTGDDGAFIEVLQRFVDRHKGDLASTEEFLAVLEETVGGEWDWFVDQWVYGTAIPTYRWEWTTTGNRRNGTLEVTVEQEDVPAGFSMPVPIEVTLRSGEVQRLIALVDDELEVFEFPLEGRVKKVELNPDDSVLARTKKR